jgi:hypothetical protein
MDEASITQHIVNTFDGVETVTMPGATFFFYGSDHMLPFATLVTNDDFDKASDLNRPGVFRLNIGIGKQAFLSLFGSKPPRPGASGTPDYPAGAYDFTALDRLMPHPDYGHLSWVCILNPSDTTFQEAVQPLLTEAYELAVRRINTRAAHAGRNEVRVMRNA